MQGFFKALLANFPGVEMKSFTWNSKKKRHRYVWRIYNIIQDTISSDNLDSHTEIKQNNTLHLKSHRT